VFHHGHQLYMGKAHFLYIAHQALRDIFVVLYSSSLAASGLIQLAR
jgi:hypothetical protein